MRNFSFLLLFLLFIPLQSMAQTSKAGLSFSRDHFPGFQLHNQHFSNSAAYSFELSYYEPDYTRLEYSLHYTRGYHSSVSYSTGFSAAYVIRLPKNILIKPGVGLDSYALADRECKSFIKGFLNIFFDMNDQCDDDVHTSLNSFLDMEIELSDAFSLLIRPSWRFMISSTYYIKESGTQTTPEGQNNTYTAMGIENSFYGAGFGIGAGVKVYLR